MLNNDKTDLLAEELGAISSLVNVLLEEIPVEENARVSSNVKLTPTTDDKLVLLEYVNGYLENCFKLLMYENT